MAKQKTRSEETARKAESEGTDSCRLDAELVRMLTMIAIQERCSVAALVRESPLPEWAKKRWVKTWKDMAPHVGDS